VAIVNTDAAYPPPHHVLRDLALQVQPGTTIHRAWLPVSEQVCNARGRVLTGIVATMVDAICGGLAAVTAAPGWIATADLSMHVGRPLEGDELGAVARVRRSGRTTVILEAEVFADARVDDPLAVCTASFSVLQRRDSNPILVADIGDDEPRRAFVGETSAFESHAYQSCGFQYLDDGVVSVEPHEYILNSLGGVQGGVLASLVDAATVHALGDDFETADLHLVYLALAKVGPIVATPAVLQRNADSGTVSIELHDDGVPRRTTIATSIGVRW
jgi:uncharacterized protein (TIGR00369 family)